MALVAMLWRFQSTHSRGVRRFVKAILSAYSNISIHALTRSATSLNIVSLLKSLYFNPRTHEECDLISNVYRQVPISFQSTHSRGVRQGYLQYYSQTWPISIHALTRSATSYLIYLIHRQKHFNPRTHEECDCRRCFLCPRRGRFQSTHSRGVRLYYECTYNGDKQISIHALTRSATNNYQRIVTNL